MNAVITPEQLVLWLLILVPAVGGAALLLARRAERYAAAISVATSAAGIRTLASFPKPVLMP